MRLLLNNITPIRGKMNLKYFVVSALTLKKVTQRLPYILHKFYSTVVGDTIVESHFLTSMSNPMKIIVINFS